MDAAKWKKVKAGGSFKRKLKKNLSGILKLSSQPVPISQQSRICDAQDVTQGIFCTTAPNVATTEYGVGKCLQQPDFCQNEWTDDEACRTQLPFSEDEDDEDDEDYKNEALLSAIRNWSIFHNIKQNALKDLIAIINDRLPNVLPKDPRTLLQTAKTVSLKPIGEGQYWHHGLRECIENIFANTNESTTISININLDGLPVYKSSKEEFWPILFNIHGMTHIKPMVIGIYSGKGKPTDLNAFLHDFVNEMNDVLTNEIIINDFKISVKLRCFICDSPARAFIKGISMLLPVCCIFIIL